MWKVFNKDGAEKKAPVTVVNPMGRVFIATGGTQSIPDSAFTQLTGLALEYAAGGMGVAGSLFTVPVAGKYLLTATINFGAQPTTVYYMPQINGAGAGAEYQSGGPGNGGNGPTYAKVLNLNAGDVVGMRVYQISGGAKTVQTTSIELVKIDGAVVSYVGVPGSLVGQELDYAQITTADTSVAGTSGAPTTIITGNPVIYDGSTPVVISFAAFSALKGTSYLHVAVFVDGVSVGEIAHALNASAQAISGEMRYTPSAGTHTVSIRAYVDAGTGHIYSGAGGAGNGVPTHMRITRAA